MSRTQNLPENIDLLAAQRRLFSDTKRFRGIRTAGSLVAAIPLPILAALVPSLQLLVTAVGGAWLLVALVLMLGFERGRTSDGARVLEEFDVNVFALSWNRRLAGKRVVPEVIASAVRRSGPDRTRLVDWYPPVVDELPWPLRVLVCQKVAAVWDWRLRRTYGALLIALTLGLFAASVVSALFLGYSTSEWLLLLALPMAAAFAGGTQAAVNNIVDAREQSEMHDRLEDDWQGALAAPSSVTATECRQHQDCRFTHRLRATPVPDWWYRSSRDRYESDMTQAATRMVREFTSRVMAEPS